MLPVIRALWLGTLVVFGLPGCSEPPAPPEEVVRSVKTVAVSRRPVGQLRRLTGVLSASEKSDLSFQVGGRVESVAVKAGERVRAGQLLASLDAQEYQIRLDSAIADLQSARARLHEAERKAASTRKLYRRNIASRQDFDSAQAAFDSARSGVQAAEAAVSLAQRDLDQTVLVAPIEGLIADRRIEPFQEVAPGQVVFRVQSRGGVEVDVRVPETLVHEVQVGQPVEVRIAMRVFGGQAFEGSVSKLSAATHDGNAYPATISIAAPDPRMRAGMTAYVDFNFQGRVDETGWLLPVNAIVPGEGESDAHITQREVFVFVYRPDTSTVERRGVWIAGMRGEDVEIRDGLAEGDRVVVAGAPFLLDGQRVALLEEPLR